MKHICKVEYHDSTKGAHIYTQADQDGTPVYPDSKVADERGILGKVYFRKKHMPVNPPRFVHVAVSWEDQGGVA